MKSDRAYSSRLWGFSWHAFGNWDLKFKSESGKPTASFYASSLMIVSSCLAAIGHFLIPSTCFLLSLAKGLQQNSPGNLPARISSHLYKKSPKSWRDCPSRFLWGESGGRRGAQRMKSKLRIPANLTHPRPKPLKHMCGK